MSLKRYNNTSTLSRAYQGGPGAGPGPRIILTRPKFLRFDLMTGNILTDVHTVLPQ